MIKLTIEGVEYFGPSGWEDITLDQFIRVSEAGIPSRLRDLLVAATDLNDLDPKAAKEAEKKYNEIAEAVTERDLVKNFPVYYGELMAILTDIPKDVIDRIDGELRAEFFDKHLRYIVLSLFYTMPIIRVGEGMEAFVPDPRESFELEGTKFYLPTTLKMYGNEVFMARESIVSFSEASEIELAYRELQDKGVERMPMFMAIYCRPIKEEYDEEKVLSREPKMRTVTMDNVWAVFFCIVELQFNYRKSILRFTKKEARRHLGILSDLG